MEIIGSIWWNQLNSEWFGQTIARSNMKLNKQTLINGILWGKDMKPIHLYRSDIKEGQVFIAHRDTIEGRDRVTLVPDNDYYARQENPEAFEDMDGQEALDRQEEAFTIEESQ